MQATKSSKKNTREKNSSDFKIDFHVFVSNVKSHVCIWIGYDVLMSEVWNEFINFGLHYVLETSIK